MADRIPPTARFAAWLYEVIGRWIVETAQPAWDAEHRKVQEAAGILEEDERGWLSGPDEDLLDSVWDDGFEHGYHHGHPGRVDPYDVGF